MRASKGMLWELGRFPRKEGKIERHTLTKPKTILDIHDQVNPSVILLPVKT